MNPPQSNTALFNLHGWASYATALAKAIHEADDVAAIGMAAMQAATQVVGASHAALVLPCLLPSSPRTVYTWNASSGLGSIPTSSLPDEQLPAHVFRQAIHDLASTDRPVVLGPQDQVASLLTPYVGFTPAIGLPLVRRGEPVGLLVMDSPAAGGEIPPEALDSLAFIGHQAGLALGHARMIAEMQQPDKLLQTESKTRHTRLSERLAGIVFAARPNGSLSYVAHRVAEQLGCPPKGWEGDAADFWARLVEPADRTAFLDAWRRALERQGSFQTRARLRHAAPGGVHWYEFRAEWVAESPGGPQLVGLGVDVTRQARYQEDVRRRAIEEATIQERERVAGELHDGLRQDLAYLLARARLVIEELAGPEGVPPADLEAIASGLENCIRDLEAAVHALRPLALADGLAEAIRRLVTEWALSSGIRAHLSVEVREIVFPPEVEPVLYRVLQEALRNVEGHAKARNVWVSLSVTDEPSVGLKVKDDGRGFTPDQLSRADDDLAGFGLASMQQRIEDLGGQFLIRTAPGEGTTIVVDIPM